MRRPRAVPDHRLRWQAHRSVLGTCVRVLLWVILLDRDRDTTTDLSDDRRKVSAVLCTPIAAQEAEQQEP